MRLLPDSPLLVITDRLQAAPRPLEWVVAAVLEGGVRWISVREKDLSPADRLALLRCLQPLAEAAGALLMVHDDSEAVGRLGLGGLHLPADGDAAVARERFPDRLIGQSWHGDNPMDKFLNIGGAGVPARDAAKGGKESIPAAAGRRAGTPALLRNIDYLTLSPIFLTASKPGYGPALGVDNLAAACSRVATPIIALGGIEATNIAACMQAGAAGVAVMGSIMRARDPAGACAELLSCLKPPARPTNRAHRETL